MTLKYIAKPATTSLIILLALFQGPNIYDTYKILILAGLLFSLIGDIYLMLPTDKFIQGLASFLIAHILFIAAIISVFGVYMDIFLMIPAAVILILYLWVLLPKTKELKFPVVVYALVLFVFMWQTTGRFYYLAGMSSFYSFVGMILFVVSDSILGYSRFVRNLISAKLLIHLTYWGALVFLALSI